MSDDAELLRRYAEENAEPAFAELVKRHVDFVFHCALRRLGGDTHAAEDVTQQVFVAVARQAATLAHHPVLTGWLYTATRNVAVQFVRTSRRRQLREQEVEVMNRINEDNLTADWERLRPVLDDALDSLSETDRQAVLLRFFEGQSFASVGARLRLSENTARMRVERALDKLHAALGRRGVTSTAAAIGVALANQASVAAAPVGLAASATAAALAGSGAAAGTSAGFVFMSMTKLQLGIASALAVAGATGFVVEARQTAMLRRDLAGAQREIQSLPALTAEQARLSAAAKTGADERARAAELARLRDEAAALRQQLQAKPQPTVASAKPARAASASSTFQVYDLKSVTRMPKPVFQAAPLYPAELRSLGINGEATVDFIIDAEGKVQNATAFNPTHPAIGAAAVEAVSRWKFEPAQKGDTKVATHLQVPIVFTISDEEQDASAKPSRGETHGIPNWF